MTLVSFPPKPFFFINLAHLDGVIRVKNKVGHATYRGLQGELNEDQTLKDASRTYDRSKLPGYRDSVPFQECLKEPRWSAYQERRWGKRLNPPAPAGDVRPGTMANVPVGERLVAPTAPILLDDESSSDSGSKSRSTSSSSESSPGPRQRVRRLTCRMLYSDPEEVSDSTTREATVSPTAAFQVLCNPLDAVLTEAVNAALVYRDQVEANEAAASGASPVIVRTSRARDQLSRVQRGGISPRTSPRGARVGTPDEQSLSSRPATPATPGESRFDWAPIDTDSWEKFEDATQQATEGITRKAMDYATDTMDLLRTDVEEQMKRRAKALRVARDSEEFRQPSQVENLMGQARYLWECNEEFKKKITTLETQRQEVEGQRAQANDERLQLRDQIKELTEEREGLWQQLENARAPPPPMAPDSQETAFKNAENAEARASQLQRECEQLSREREALERGARTTSCQHGIEQGPGAS